KCKMCGGALEINDNKTVAECEYCGTKQTLPKLDDERKANLYDRANHKPSQLSGGEQQRVAVARALINSPSIILADEPSGNLDSRNAKELHEYFFKLRETYKQTFLIVTHSEELAKMSDRMIEMQDGKII
ncbi:MAG: ATP-binding cassette domain-containing protein, partial [Bacteroidales bacterium]|nr:ATP-binding cassette domain-containing protein [Bacteroidales bacterium]